MNKKILFETLNNIGVPCNLSGREYIEEAIEMLMSSDEIPLLNTIYIDIGKKHNLHLSAIERAIRLAIDGAFENSNNAFHRKVFGNTIKSSKPTNSEFLHGLTKYFEIMYKE